MASIPNRITGTGADDTLAGTAQADLLRGVAGDDTLLGLAGDDALAGGVGADVLDGGSGSDVLEGGHGADVFVFSWDEVLVQLPPEGATETQIRLGLGHDVVTDFQLGADRMEARPAMPLPAPLSGLLQLSEADVDGDGTLDTVLRIDYVDAATGLRTTDPTTSITLLGVSGATVDQLFA